MGIFHKNLKSFLAGSVFILFYLLFLFLFRWPGPFCLVTLPCLPTFFGWTVGTWVQGQLSVHLFIPGVPSLAGELVAE